MGSGSERGAVMHANVLARTTTKATISSGREALFVSRNEMDMWGMIQNNDGSVFLRRAYDTEITTTVHLSVQIMILWGIPQINRGPT